MATAVTVLVAGLVVIRLPPTHFRTAAAGRRTPTDAAGWARRIARNVIGVALVVAGGVLSLPGVPGQGLLTMLIGVILLDIPGRRRVERALIGRAGVLAKLNRVRAWFGKPPLEAPE